MSFRKIFKKSSLKIIIIHIYILKKMHYKNYYTIFLRYNIRLTILKYATSHRHLVRYIRKTKHNNNNNNNNNRCDTNCDYER